MRGLSTDHTRTTHTLLSSSKLENTNSFDTVRDRTSGRKIVYRLPMDVFLYGLSFTSRNLPWHILVTYGVSFKYVRICLPFS